LTETLGAPRDVDVSKGDGGCTPSGHNGGFETAWCGQREAGISEQIELSTHITVTPVSEVR
jgi:hypothetical protein